jgi:hypothetical protein
MSKVPEVSLLLRGDSPEEAPENDFIENQVKFQDDAIAG